MTMLALGGSSNQTELVKAILQAFSERIQQAVKDGLLSKDYVINYVYQRGRKAHGRIIGILARVGCDLKYLADFDCNFFGGKSRFDVIYRKDGDVVALIDYESLNSYNVRGKHEHFEGYIRNCMEQKRTDYLPKACILIVTLPKIPITGSLPYYRDKRYSVSYREKFKAVKQNLYEYWYPKHKEALLKINKDAFQKTAFCLSNLNEEGLSAQIWRSPDEESIKLNFPLAL